MSRFTIQNNLIIFTFLTSSLIGEFVINGTTPLFYFVSGFDFCYLTLILAVYKAERRKKDQELGFKSIT